MMLSGNHSFNLSSIVVQFQEDRDISYFLFLPFWTSKRGKESLENSHSNCNRKLKNSVLSEVISLSHPLLSALFLLPSLDLLNPWLLQGEYPRNWSSKWDIPQYPPLEWYHFCIKRSDGMHLQWTRLDARLRKSNIYTPSLYQITLKTYRMHADCCCRMFRLYAKGRVLGYTRGKRNQKPNVSLIQVEGAADLKEARWYVGKRVAYVYKAQREINGSKTRIIWGVVRRPHGPLLPV